MKIILTESQYKGMIKAVKDYENKLSFMKQNLRTALESDIFSHLHNKYKGEKQRYGINPDESFQINLEYLANEIGGRPRILVWIDVKDNYVQAMVTIGGFRLGSADKMSTIKWRFDDENGEETFYSKLDKNIEQRMSQGYQDKILEKYRSRI